MTYTTGTLEDVVSFNGLALPQANTRRAIVSVVAAGLGAAAAVSAVAAVGAACVLAATLVTEPTFQGRAPRVTLPAPATVADEGRALVNPYGTLTGLSRYFQQPTQQAPAPQPVARPAVNRAPPMPPSANFLQVLPSAAPAVQADSGPPMPTPRPTDVTDQTVADDDAPPLPPSNPFMRPAGQVRREVERPVLAPQAPAAEAPRVASTTVHEEEPRQPPVAAPRPAAAPPQAATAAGNGHNPFQKFFDFLKQPPQTSSPGVAYAPGGRTAIYDIAAHTVYLPNGERLEAHSGLRNLLDDPGHVNVKDRGATPPHLYELTLRGPLFHGVSALRLNPVGGGAMYGRVGLLAHTYMLGPNGDSNGCVSFRDYRRFLEAYEHGQITHLQVVTHIDSRMASN